MKMSSERWRDAGREIRTLALFLMPVKILQDAD